MTTRNRKRPDSGPEPQAEPAAETVTPIERLSVPLTADRSDVDWAKVRPSRRPEIERLMGRGNGSALPASAAASLDMVTPEYCRTLLDMVGRLEVSLIANVYHVSDTDAAIMLYTDEEKRVLSEPLAKIINKYGGSALSKYGDEIMLAVAVASIHGPKIAHVRQLSIAARGTRGPRTSDDTPSLSIVRPKPETETKSQDT